MSQMNRSSTIPIESILGPREESSPLALYNNSIWEQFSLYQQRNDWNRENEASYLSYLDANYASVREGLRRETEDSSVQFFRNLIDVASAANYDLDNGLFSLDYVNADENGPRLVKATQATYNRMFLLASGMENRSSLAGLAATGAGRTTDAAMLNAVPEGPIKDSILRLIQDVGGQDMLSAFEEDRRGVNALPGVFNDLLFRNWDEDRSLKFLGGKAAEGYLPVIQYEDASWSGGVKEGESLSPAQQKLWEQLTNREENPMWESLLRFGGIGPEILEGTNNIGHAMYKINNALLSTSIMQHRPNFSDFEAFAFTLPTMLIDDAETAIELGLSGAAMAVSSLVPGAGALVGAGVAANSLRRMRRITDAAQDISKLSRVIGGGIRGFQSAHKATSRVTKIINPFEFISDLGMPGLSALRAVARKENTFMGGFRASKLRQSQDKLYDWRQFLIGSALEGGISEFGAYFGNLADSIEIADAVYGEGNHLVGFNLGDLVLGVAAGAGFGTVLGTTMRGVFSGAQQISSFAFTPLATKVMNNVSSDPNGVMMQSIKGYRRLAFQAHAEGVVNLNAPNVVNKIDNMFFDTEYAFGESLTQEDILEAARIVSKQHRKSGKDFMSAEEFVDSVRRVAANNKDRLLDVSSSVINKNKVQRRKLNKDLERQLKATKRGPEESRKAAARKVKEIEEELSELNLEFSQANAQRKAIAAMTVLEAQDADSKAWESFSQQQRLVPDTKRQSGAPRKTTPVEQVPTSFETLSLQPLKAVVSPLKQKQKQAVQEFFDLLNRQNFDDLVNKVEKGTFMDSPQQNQLVKNVLTPDTLGALKRFVEENNRAPQLKDLKQATDADFAEVAKTKRDPFGDKPGGRPQDLEFDANMSKKMFDKFLEAYVEKQQTLTAVDYDKLVNEFRDAFLSLKIEKGLVDKLAKLTERYPAVIRMFSPEYFWTLRYVFRTGKGPNIPELSSTAFDMAGAAAGGALAGAPTEAPESPLVSATPATPEGPEVTSPDTGATEPRAEQLEVTQETPIDEAAADEAEAQAKEELFKERRSISKRLDDIDTRTLAGLIVKEGQVRATRQRDIYKDKVAMARDKGNTSMDINMAKAFFPHLEATINGQGKDGKVSLDVIDEAIDDVYELMMEDSRKVNLDNINMALFRIIYNNDKGFDELTLSEMSFNKDLAARFMKLESLDPRNAVVEKKTQEQMEELQKTLTEAATGPKNESTDNIPNTITIEDFLRSGGERRAILEARLLAESVSAMSLLAERNNDGKLSVQDMVRSVPPGFEKLVDQITANLRPDADNRFNYKDVIQEFAALALVREQDSKFGYQYTTFLDQVGTQAEIANIQRKTGRGEKFTDEGLATVLDHIDKELSLGKILARRLQEETGTTFNGAETADGWQSQAVYLGRSALKSGWRFGIDVEKIKRKYGIDEDEDLLETVINDFNEEFASEVSGEVTPFQALGNGELDFVDPATAVVAILQAAGGNPEGHATSFAQSITQFDASDNPIPSKEAKGTVVVNEFSPTNTAKRLLMYEEFVFQDRIRRILFDVDEDGNILGRKKMTDEDMDIAEAWIKMDPQATLSKTEQEAVDRFGLKEPGFRLINKENLVTEKDKNLAEIWNKMRPEKKKLSESELKAVQIYGRKHFGTDMVAHDRKGAMRLVPGRAIASIDEVIPNYEMYKANAYLDMLVYPPGLIRTTHDQFNLLKENGFLFGTPRADAPGMGNIFTPYARTDSGVQARGVTSGMATAQAAPGLIGDLYNRAEELLFPNLLGVADRARRSWHNAVKSDDFKKLSKELFGIEDITTTEEFQIAKKQADKLRENRRIAVEANEPDATLMSDEEYAEVVGILYTMTADEWDANASGNSIMMASTVKKNEMNRYLASDEKYSELITNDKNLVDQYKQVYDYMTEELRDKDNLKAIPENEREALQWWLDNVFVEGGLEPSSPEWADVRSGLMKGSAAVMAKTYGIGYSTVKKNIKKYLDETFDYLDEKTRNFYAQVLARRMSYVRGANVSNLVAGGLGLPNSTELRDAFFKGNDITIELPPDETGRKRNPITVNFEQAIMAKSGEENIGEGTISLIIDDMYPEDGLNETRKVNLKIVLQIARQAYQFSTLFEGDKANAAILNKQGIPTDFPSLLRQMLKNYSDIVHDSIKQAEEQGDPSKALDIVKARLARAAQKSLKVDGMNALRRSAIHADRDMAQEYAALAGFDLDDVDPRTRLAFTEAVYSDWLVHQEGRQQTLDGTMGTQPTRIQSDEKPGGIFNIASDPYAGKTKEEAVRDVRQRAIEQALIDASPYKRFADGDDPTMEDFYSNLYIRNIQPENTDFRVKAAKTQDRARGLQAEMSSIKRALANETDKDARMDLREKQKKVQKQLDMIAAWDRAFAKNNTEHNPNLAGRLKVIGNEISPDPGSKNLSFSSQQDGFHGMFPEYARKSLREVMGIPALRRFALSKSRFGSNIKKSLNDNPPVVNTDDEVLSVPSIWTNKAPVVGSLTDLIQSPGLIGLTVPERASQLQVRLIRAAAATKEGSNLRKMVEEKRWDEAYVYVARKEVKERAHRRAQLAFENLNLTTVKDKEQKVAEILFKLKTEEEKEFQTLFSGFASSSERREVSLTEMDPQNNITKIATGDTWIEGIINTGALEGSQAERSYLVSWVYSEPQHVTRVIYEGTSGELLENDVSGGRGDRADTALNALIAFHSDSFQIIVPSALWSRLLAGQFYKQIDSPSPVKDENGNILTWNEAIKQGKITTASAIAQYSRDFAGLGNREALVDIVRQMNRDAGDNAFADINLIDNWGIKIDIIDDTESVPVTEKEARVLEKLSQGTLSIDPRNAEASDQELFSVVNTNGRLFDEPTKTFINGFGEALRTNKIKGDIRVSLTKDQKLTGLLYSRNQSIVRDMQILKQFNLQQLNSREAESTRVSAYIPDILLDRTNLQQMPPGSLDMHLRYLAQMDTKAIQMMMKDQKIRIMTDATQSGMDDDGNIVSGTVAEYLNFEKYSRGNGMSSIDNLIEEDLALSYGLSGDFESKATQTALTMFHYGVPNRWAHLAAGILGTNKAIRDLMSEGESLMYDDLPESLKTEINKIQTIASSFTKQVDAEQRALIAQWQSQTPSVSLEALSELDTKTEVYYRLRDAVGSTMRFKELLALSERLFNDSDALRHRRLRNITGSSADVIKESFTSSRKFPIETVLETARNTEDLPLSDAQSSLLESVTNLRITRPEGFVSLSEMQDLYQSLRGSEAAQLLGNDPLVDFENAVVVEDPDNAVVFDKVKAKEIFVDTMLELGMTREEINNMPEIKDPEGWIKDKKKTVVVDIETTTDENRTILALGVLKKGDDPKESIRFGTKEGQQRSAVSSDQARQLLRDLEDLQNQGYKVVTFNGNNFDIPAILSLALQDVAEGTPEALDLNRLATRVSLRSIDMMQSVASKHPQSRSPNLMNLAKAAQADVSAKSKRLKSEDVKGSDIATLWDRSNQGDAEAETQMLDYIGKDLESTLVTFDSLVDRFENGKPTTVEFTNAVPQDFDGEPIELMSSFNTSLKFRNMDSRESINTVFENLRSPGTETVFSKMRSGSLTKLTDQSKITFRLTDVESEVMLRPDRSTVDPADKRNDLVDAIIEESGGRQPVELLFRGSLIKTSSEDPLFTSFSDLVLFLVDEARSNGSITAKNQQELDQLVTLLSTSSEVRDVLTDLEIVFSDTTNARYNVITEKQGTTYGRIEIPGGPDVTFERTIKSLTHEIIHHTVRSHLLKMTSDEYGYFKDLVFTSMFGDTSGIKNLAEADANDIKSIRGIFDRLARETGVSQEISDTVVRTFNDLRNKGVSHAKLEYFLVQEFFAYGITYASSGGKITSRKTIELSEIMTEFLQDFKIPGSLVKDDPTPGSLADGITQFLFAQRKTTMDMMTPDDRPFGMTLYDQTTGARQDGNPYQDHITELSTHLARIKEALKATDLKPEQIDKLKQEQASVESALYRMTHTTERLSNDLDIEEVVNNAMGEDGRTVDFTKVHDEAMKREIAVRRLAELALSTEVDQPESRIQQIMDAVGISTTGMNIVRGHHLSIVRALGTMLNPDTWFAAGRFGAERGMITLQSISVMERGEVENITQSFVVAVRSLNKAGFSSAEINEAFRLYVSDTSIGPKLDPQMLNGIKPVAEKFLRYLQNVARRAKDEGIINEKVYSALMNGELPLRLKRSALESSEQINRIQFAIADNYRKKFLSKAPNTTVSAIAVIGHNLIPSPRVFTKDILETRYKDLSDRIVEWAEGDVTLDWSTDVVSRVQGALAQFRSKLKIGKITREDLQKLGILEAYDDAIDKPLNGASITEFHNEIDSKYEPSPNITAAQYHAGRMMYFLKNNSYKFDDPFLDFTEVAADPILKPFLEFNPLQVIQGLRRGISHEAYERYMIRKVLGIQGIDYTDLINYAESVTDTGKLVPTVEDGKIVTKVLNKDDMRKVNKSVFDILRDHRNTARGVFPKPETAGSLLDGIDKTSDFLTKTLSYPFWALASIVVEGGFSSVKTLGRALSGPAAEVHEAFASLNVVDQAHALELLGMQIYNMTAQVDLARYGGQDLESIDVVLDMIEAEADGQMSGDVRERLKGLAQKTGQKMTTMSKMGFNRTQRYLRAVEIPNAINKLGKDINRFPQFIDALDKFIEDNERSPTKKERQRLMRESGLGNSDADMNRLAKYMDSGLMDKDVVEALKRMLANQAKETFSFDTALHRFVTFGTESERDVNLRALMAFRDYLYRMATDTNLESNVGDTQVLVSKHITGRFIMRLTSYASLAFRMYRNLLFAAPASLALAYLSAYYVLENLYSSLARIARGSNWKDELDRWTNFNEKPVETVATYISAGVALPQVLGFGAPIVSSLLNSVVHSLGYDTPSRLLLPGGASAIGFGTALDGLSGMRSIFQSFVTDQPVDQSAVSDALAFSSYAGFPSVLVRLGHSVSKTEQTGLAGQSADRRGSQGFFYKPEAELYRGAERYPYVPSEPGFGPVEKFRAEPFTIPKNAVAQPGMPTSPQSPATGQMPVAGEQPPAAPPSQLEPGSSLFQEDVQTTPGSLFDQR